MTTPDFASCRAKLDRARHNLDEFERALIAFTESTTYGFFAQPDSERTTSYYNTWWRVTLEMMSDEQIPPDVAAMLGDVLHDWRSALDHLAWQLAIRAGSVPPPPRTEFPIFWDAGDFGRTRKSGAPAHGSGLFKIQGLSAEDRTRIERTQPYYAGEPIMHPLWVLHELSNLDKHRAPPTTVTASSCVLSRPFVTGMRITNTEHVHGPFQDGAVVARFKVQRDDGDTDPEMQVDGKASFAVLIEHAGHRIRIGKTLQAIRAEVERIVETFEA